MYVGHVCTCYATLCVFRTCIDGFDDVHVWIHVEIESDDEMRFICYIVIINVICGIYICYKCDSNAMKQQKKNPSFADSFDHSCRQSCVFFADSRCLPTALVGTLPTALFTWLSAKNWTLPTAILAWLSANPHFANSPGCRQTWLCQQPWLSAMPFTSPTDHVAVGERTPTAP